MLRDYPRVKRWEDSDDVLQNALIRLLQALAAVKISTAKDFYALAALQIRRELLDLAVVSAVHRESERITPAHTTAAPTDHRHCLRRNLRPARSIRPSSRSGQSFTDRLTPCRKPNARCSICSGIKS